VGGREPLALTASSARPNRGGRISAAAAACAEHRKRRGNEYYRQDHQTCQYRHVTDLLIGLRGMPIAAKESPESRSGASA
jgi:hypothetical protein